LERCIELAHPQLLPRLRPGLSREAIEGIARPLSPYHLPAELLTVYQWRDGWVELADGEYHDLLPDATFNSLSEAVDTHTTWLEALGSAGWHPLWFPAFGTQTGELVALQLEPERPAGAVYAFHEDTGLETSYDSVATLFATALELWRAGALPVEDHTYLPAGLREIQARLNPLSRDSHGACRRELSRFSTEDWPPAWRDVLGTSP